MIQRKAGLEEDLPWVNGLMCMFRLLRYCGLNDLDPDFKIYLKK